MNCRLLIFGINRSFYQQPLLDTPETRKYNRKGKSGKACPKRQYARPEIIGLVLGAFVISMATGEFRSSGGSAPMIRFILGMVIMIGSLIFLGCPLRQLILPGASDAYGRGSQKEQGTGQSAGQRASSEDQCRKACQVKRQEGRIQGRRLRI